MEVGRYNDVPDWPKMGPSLLIATCLIVAIRTAKWSATIDARNSNSELDKEITFCRQRSPARPLRTHERTSISFPEQKAALVSSDERRQSRMRICRACHGEREDWI